MENTTERHEVVLGTWEVYASDLDVLPAWHVPVYVCFYLEVTVTITWFWASTSLQISVRFICMLPKEHSYKTLFYKCFLKR